MQNKVKRQRTIEIEAETTILGELRFFIRVDNDVVDCKFSLDEALISYENIKKNILERIEKKEIIKKETIEL